MKTATITLWLDPGHSVEKKNVTPAEVQLLAMLHKNNAKKIPITDIRDIEEKEFHVRYDSDIAPTKENSRTEIKNEWTKRFELRRLVSRYGMKKVKELYPSPNTEMPATFEDALASVVDSDEEELVTTTTLQKKGTGKAILFAQVGGKDVEATEEELAALVK